MIYEEANTPDTRISAKDVKPTTTKAKVLSNVKHLYWLVQASNLSKSFGFVDDPYVQKIH